MNAVTRAADLRPNQRPIDPNVKVPEAVRRAAEAAEAAHKAQYGEQTPLADPNNQNTPSNPDTISIAPDGAPTTPPAPPVTQPQATPPVTPQGNEPPAPQPTPAPTLPGTPAELEVELQRIRSAEGRKRAALEQQLGTAADRIAILENMVEELQRSVRAPAQPAPAPQPLITQQERESFGDEMLDVVGRRAKEAISPELAELRAMMDTLSNKLTGTVTTVQQTSKQAMMSSLDQQIPNWREINLQPDFKAWLALPDPYFGVSRHSALTSAWEKNDTSRVLNFFRGFVSELAAQAPAEPPVPAPPPAPQAPAKPSLETLAAPGRARTSAQPNAPTEKQIITTADINAFYSAVRQGLYRGREAEKEALEQELFAAQREGRVKQV